MSRTCINPLLIVLIITTSCLLLPSCASVPRIFHDVVPAGSLRLGQVVSLVPRNEVLATKEIHETLTSFEIKDTEIRDGSNVFVRIYCCGGANESKTASVVYVPSEIEAKKGDVIEYRVGRLPKNGNRGELNTATQIRMKYGEKSDGCRWDPPNNKLWTRTIFCKWMENEGWAFQDGLYNAWFKPPL